MNRLYPRLIWALVAIVLAVALIRVFTARSHHSADQQILIDKSR